MVSIRSTKNYHNFIGTDVSRDTLDHAVMQGDTLMFHKRIANIKIEIEAFLLELKKLPKFSFSKSVFCMEHTGIYSAHLLLCLKKRKANVVVEAGLHIKNSLGSIRGKNDKIDAIRIAEYAYNTKDRLRLLIDKRPIISQLAELNTLRNRVLSVYTALKTPLKEQSHFTDKLIAQHSSKLCFESINALKNDIERIDIQIKDTISQDQRVNRLMEIITSIPSIGFVTALNIIITTNEFITIRDPKKFACYAGVAPFIIESGKLKGRARVSHLANKKMKALLHLCAISTKKSIPEINAYYERKTKIEGKSKMSVINAIRFKLVLRVFACVNQDRCYEKAYVR